MTAIDMSQFIVAKSDQLNADDLIGGPMTLEITKVSASPDSAEQPISIHYKGGDGRPFKPCKSMRRVLVHCWGVNGADYVGRAMTVYREEGVMFGGIKVGGIRISHMSHIERDTVMALMVTRGKRLPYAVKPLRGPEHRAPQANRDDIRTERQPADADTSAPLSLAQRVDGWKRRISQAPNTIKAKAMWANSEELRNALDAADPDTVPMTSGEMETFFNERFEALETAEREGK